MGCGRQPAGRDPRRARGHRIIAVVTSSEGTVNKTLLHKRFYPMVHGAKLHIIKPSRPLAVRSWDFDVDRMNYAIDEGYQQGRAFLR